MSTPSGPIFIGGTGRSGTSVMAQLLGSHPQIVHPAHENKLIVEAGGLMDLVDQLTNRPDIYRQHAAVTEFAKRARQYRLLGFQKPALNDELRRMVMDEKKPAMAVFEHLARRNPGEPVNIQPLGENFGLPHYDACVKAFLGRLYVHVAPEGLLVSDGIARPFVVPKLFTREAILAECRKFLDDLYSAPMAAAAASRWCDDAPSNWLYLDFLHELYPNMRFVHMVRDLRDVTASFMAQPWAPSDPVAVATLLKGQFQRYNAVRASIPADCLLEVRLEDLGADPPGVMAQIAEFLGVDPTFDLSRFKPESTGKRDYSPEVERVVASELGPWMRRYGYAETVAAG